MAGKKGAKHKPHKKHEPRKPNGKMGGPTRSPVERVEHQAKVLAYAKRGFTQSHIGELLGISQAMVSVDFRVAMTAIKKERSDAGNAIIDQETAILKEVRKEAWVEWERSKTDAESETTENGLFGDKESHGSKKTRAGRLGNVTYLNVVIECGRRICELEGVEPDKTLHLKGSMQVLNWDALAQGVVEGKVDRVEEMLAKEMAQPLIEGPPADAVPVEATNASSGSSQADPKGA